MANSALRPQYAAGQPPSTLVGSKVNLLWWMSRRWVFQRQSERSGSAAIAGCAHLGVFRGPTISVQSSVVEAGLLQNRSEFSQPTTPPQLFSKTFPVRSPSC